MGAKVHPHTVLASFISTITWWEDQTATWTMAWWMVREPTLRNQALLHLKTGSGLNRLWTGMGLLLRMLLTQVSLKAPSKRIWLDQSTEITKGIQANRIRSCPVLEALVVWWHKAKAWIQDNSSNRQEGTRQASPSGSKGPVGWTDQINKWLKCSIKCNLRQETSREKAQAIKRIDFDYNLINKQLIV